MLALREATVAHEEIVLGSVNTDGEYTVLIVPTVYVSDTVLVDVTEPSWDTLFVRVVVESQVVSYKYLSQRVTIGHAVWRGASAAGASTGAARAVAASKDWRATRRVCFGSILGWYDCKPWQAATADGRVEFADESG